MGELNEMVNRFYDTLEQRELQIVMLEAFLQRLKEGMRDGVNLAKLQHLIDLALEKSKEINESLEGK